ncbi:pre-mRNA-splicing factor ATP-dependent RNA helicase PRP16, putative [Plasmodium knowlesi strain H]|uniref:RNA helicase n=3 Tax=Plasmodium knowlesi TaxID=5850 RepID=A0A5K1V011_PLAKH|nr:pre-mRNA-splicing factor ATP-dependent RNA helicase PRP16, putative [Plasmodium knowlesi strain H]OTN64420.1 putative Pre-mRNA-splicing factor ATP-dependent RNA helicase PRP16 [Plasmodium knowlesi]CAA9988899.1 pre-mRNA-splicing factor ATP-dependent RNA helicase PRP16, putative [Plasmodium knowlesi strain H]SBO24742.1 pre-mRNA-splicing factor ATP-dependent RNA helicase PRP16, putative [Plasmodium knowlesi strain H]SBO28008.1 pre-mRNA-splicing factor ATP-dependent RNA helicase PRP16, putative |eukprot:XP_002261246.1 splicing factor, putative [Plasmodium knowlesi strain H]
MIAKTYLYNSSSSDDADGAVEKVNRKTSGDNLTFKRRKINREKQKGCSSTIQGNVFKNAHAVDKEFVFVKRGSSDFPKTDKRKTVYAKKSNFGGRYKNEKRANSVDSSSQSDEHARDHQSESSWSSRSSRSRGRGREGKREDGRRSKEEQQRRNINTKSSDYRAPDDKKKQEEYYKRNYDRIMDEIWYSKEDDCCVDSFYNMDIDSTYHKEKKMIANFSTRMNSAGKKVNQKNLDNNLWELNKLKQGGVHSTYNKLQLEKINEANSTNEVRKVVLTRHVTPSFIEILKNDTQSGEGGRKEKHEHNSVIDQWNAVSHDMKKTSTSYSTVVKDETCDFVKAAKKGSEFLRYFKNENENAKARDRYWEIGRSKLGELLKMYKEKKTNSTTNYGRSGDLVEDEDRDGETNTDIFDYKKDKMYSTIFNEESKKKQKSTLQDKADLLKLKESLPIFRSKKELLDAVYNNNIIIIVGETGSGKTTQIVQYLYEDGYHKNGIICCTQPRRVAAVSVAYRVSHEMNVEIGSLVGYTIRFEDNTTKDTKIRYVTDGILLRETLTDKDLDKYSVIIMDEAHERSINTDVLLGILKNICLKRNDLKLLVTSATIDSKKFSEFFGNAPIYNIQGRTFKVHLEYLRSPCNDYIECAVQKAIEIHISDNNYDNNFGDILIFMTGQEDINATCYLLSERFYEVYESYKESKSHKKKTLNKIKSIISEKTDRSGKNAGENQPHHQDDSNCSGDDSDYGPQPLDVEEITQKDESENVIYPFYVFPIYSQLSSEQQSKIFQKYDLRKIIVSTNIAETSLTLDGIKYVIDSGYCKLKVYNQKIGMDVLQITPISQANANQRSGRAGRTGAGICYRLYTENTFLCDLYPNNIPEIQRSNLANVVLLLKSLNVENVFEFDFIDIPSRESIINSLHELWVLGAINNEGNLTDIGKKMILFPLDPPLSKILIYSENFECTKEILIIVSMLSSAAIFLEAKENSEAIESKKEKFTVPESDHLTLLNIYLQWRSHNYSASWCAKNFIQYKSLNKAKEVYSQLTDIIKTLKMKNASCNNKWECVRKTICSGYFHNAAKLKSISEYVNLRTNVSCHVHPSSSLYNIGYTPDYVVYQEIVFTTKEFMRNVTTVDPEWLCELGPLFFYMKNS